MTKKKTNKTMKVKVYSTKAECYRDVHEFYSALLEQTGDRISPNIKQWAGDSGCDLEFIVHERFEKTLNSKTIKAAVDSVSDASDINEFMKVETYEFPADWWKAKSLHSLKWDLNPSSVENCRKYKLIKTEYFCKMFDDVYDVIENES